MSNITDSELLKYNQEGLIPSPNESEEDFLKRTLLCTTIQEQLIKEMSDELPFITDTLEDHKIIEEAFPITEKLFDIKPSWVPIFFSNYQLTPWHGGCAWIFQMAEDSATTAFLQMRKNFKENPVYLKLYKRQELIAHELAHIGRMTFEEPLFEEILAYRTSDSFFRKWLGPIVQSAGESIFFMIVLALILMLDIYLILTEQYETYLLASWAKMIPALMILYAFVRLWNRHRTFNRCLVALKTLFQDEKIANAVIYRLSDHEIKLFSKGSQDEIIQYAKEQQPKSLRWRLIHLAYFK